MTNIVSRPLELPSRVSMRVDMDTYPMRPYTMPCDMYEESDLLGGLNGLRRVAPFQHDTWFLEPFYKDCTNIIIDAEAGKAYTDRGFPLPDGIINKKCLSAFEEQSQLNSWPTDVRYVHCLRSWTNVDGNSAVEGQAVLVVDMIVKNADYLTRRRLLESNFELLGFKRTPMVHSPNLIPRFPESDAADLWAGLHLSNQTMPGAPRYGGIVEKRSDSPYLHSKEAECSTGMSWVFHPFKSLK